MEISCCYESERTFVRATPNPNDEEAVFTVVVQGQGPSRRAGHTATAVGKSTSLEVLVDQITW